MITPSRTTTAPTGTSPSAAAVPARRNASRICSLACGEGPVTPIGAHCAAAADIAANGDGLSDVQAGRGATSAVDGAASLPVESEVSRLYDSARLSYGRWGRDLLIRCRSRESTCYRRVVRRREHRHEAAALPERRTLRRASRHAGTGSRARPRHGVHTFATACHRTGSRCDTYLGATSADEGAPAARQIRPRTRAGGLPWQASGRNALCAEAGRLWRCRAAPGPSAWRRRGGARL